MVDGRIRLISFLSALFDLISDCVLIYLTDHFIGKITAFFVLLKSVWTLIIFVWICYLVLKRNDIISPNTEPEANNNRNDYFWNGLNFYYKCAKYWLWYGYIMILFIIVIIADAKYPTLVVIESLRDITLLLFIFMFITLIRSIFVLYIKIQVYQFINQPETVTVLHVPANNSQIPYVVVASALFDFITDGALVYGTFRVIGFVTPFSIAIKAVYSSSLFLHLCYVFPQRNDFWKMAAIYVKIATYCLGYSYAVTGAAVIVIFDSGYAKGPKLLSDKSMNSVVFLLIISMLTLIIRSLFLIIFTSCIRRQVWNTRLPNVQYQVQNDTIHILSDM